MSCKSQSLGNRSRYILLILSLWLPSIRMENLTLQDATTVAKKSLNTDDLEVIDFNVKPFSSEILGYLSEQKLLTIEVRIKNKTEANQTLTFFVKTISPSANAYNKMVFREESKFFGDVLPQLLENNKSEPWAANSYLARDDVIVLENLKPYGYGIVKKILPIDNLRSAVAAVARYHASSMLLEEKLKKTLDEVYPGFFREKTFLNYGDFAWKWLLTGIEVAETVAENLKLNSSLVRVAYDSMLEKIKPVKGGNNVLSHSDLWTNNIMFAGNGDGMKCRLVDFQMVTYSSHVMDLVQLIYLDSLKGIRQKFETELVELYHTELVKSLRENGHVKEVMSLDEVFRAVEEKRICGLVTAVQFFPIALLNEELSNEYGKDPEKFQDYSFKSRKNFVLEAMKKDNDYKNRVEDIVKELLEYMQRR